MTAVAVAPRGRTEILQWLAPSPVWDGPVGPAASGLTQPRIVELQGDDFMDELLGLLDGTAGSPADLAGLTPDTTTDGTAAAPYRLYQPLSGRYYLVTATLACRRPGVPDHRLRPERHERVYFVMRRLKTTQDDTVVEQAFVPAGDGDTWVDVAPGSFVEGEQEHPLHQAPVAPYAEPGTTAAALGLGKDDGHGRSLWVGYVPVGLERTLTRPMTNPVGRFQALLKAKADGDADLASVEVRDPRLDVLTQRVTGLWPRIAASDPTYANRGYATLYLLLDLGDWLRTHLKTEVLDHLGDATPAATAYGALVAQLQQQDVLVDGGSSVKLAATLKAVEKWSMLLQGEDPPSPNPGPPPLQYRLPFGSPGTLYTLAAAALKAANRPPTLPPELEGMIGERPDEGTGGTPASGKSTGSTYVARLVLRYDPCCCVMSEPSHPFQLARALDADAPARKILLQVPDINHMRAFKRGVAIETPSSLQSFLNRITPDFLKDDSLESPKIELGMICSFSLQIIFMVAFIVMFIFLILLNLIFWWLPFLKICFPIPVKPSSSNGPTP